MNIYFTVMFKPRLLYGLLLIFIIYSNVARAQQPVQVEKFSTEHGLLHPNVSALLNDSRGQLWVGTVLGLQRFDGFSFKPVGEGKYITVIAEGDHETIFYGTNHGAVHRVYLENYCYRDSLVDSSDAAMVRGLYWEPVKKELWITRSRKQLEIITLNGQKNKIRYPGEEVQTMVADKDGTLFLAGTYGLKRTVPSKGKNISTVFPDTLLYDVEIDKRGWLWYSTASTVSCINKETGHHYRTWKKGEEGLLFYESNNLHTDANGDLYLTENSGVWKYDEDAGRFMRLDFFNENGDRRNYQVYSFCGTQDQIKWMGTIYGLIRMDERKSVFRNIYTEKYVETAMPLSVRSTFEAGKDTFLVGTTGQGIYRLILHNGNVSMMPYVNHHTQHVSDKIFNTVNTIYRDHKNKYWFGTNDDVMYFDPVTKLSRQVHHTTYVWHFAESGPNQLWMAARELGLHWFDTEKGQYISYKPDHPMKVFHIRKDSIFLVLATDKGVRYFNTVVKKYNTGWALGDKLRRQIKNTVWDIRKTGGLYYFTTEGSGLIRYDTHSDSIRIFKQYPNMYGMEADEKGYLWIVLDQGMAQFDPVKEKFRFFNTKEGLVSDHFAFYGLLKLKNGNFLCAGERGFTLFDPLKVSPLPGRYEVYISSLQVSGKPYADLVKDGDRLTFGYLQNDLSITFGTSDHHNPGGKVYRYLLEGWDHTWNSSAYHTISYQNITPGSYKLIVYVEGNENEKAVIDIRILPPFWQTIWFRSLVIVSLAAIIAYLIYVRMMRVRRKYLIENQLLESEVKALRSQMNPHFIFNALGSIQHYIISAEKDKAALYLSRFAKLMREVLHYSSLQKITLEEEIALLSNYLELEALRFENKFSWSIDLEDGVDADLSIPTLMIQPLVENAVKHGVAHLETKGCIDIVFSMQGSYVKCMIADNGLGRGHYKTLRKNHESKGTRMLQDRLDHINKIYKTSSYIQYREVGNESKGTVVEVLIPIV